MVTISRIFKEATHLSFSKVSLYKVSCVVAYGYYIHSFIERSREVLSLRKLNLYNTWSLVFYVDHTSRWYGAKCDMNPSGTLIKTWPELSLCWAMGRTGTKMHFEYQKSMGRDKNASKQFCFLIISSYHSISGFFLGVSPLYSSQQANENSLKVRRVFSWDRTGLWGPLSPHFEWRPSLLLTPKSFHSPHSYRSAHGSGQPGTGQTWALAFSTRAVLDINSRPIYQMDWARIKW